MAQFERNQSICNDSAAINMFTFLAVPGFNRKESTKALGVTFSHKLSVSKHVDELLAACAQTLFALRTLRHHGLPSDALHTVFQSIVVAKLSYAASA